MASFLSPYCSITLDPVHLQFDRLLEPQCLRNCWVRTTETTVRSSTVLDNLLFSVAKLRNLSTRRSFKLVHAELVLTVTSLREWAMGTRSSSTSWTKQQKLRVFLGVPPVFRSYGADMGFLNRLPKVISTYEALHLSNLSCATELKQQN